MDMGTAGRGRAQRKRQKKLLATVCEKQKKHGKPRSRKSSGSTGLPDADFYWHRQKRSRGSYAQYDAILEGSTLHGADLVLIHVDTRLASNDYEAELSDLIEAYRPVMNQMPDPAA